LKVGALSVLIAALLLSASVAGGTAPVDVKRVLFVGNSLTYVNNLPEMFAALANAGGRPMVSVDALVTGGGLIAERKREGVLAKLLSGRKFDVLVLQERGGLLACLAENAPDASCRDSVNAHRSIVNLAMQYGTKVVLYGTWGEAVRNQSKVSIGLIRLSKILNTQAVDVGAVFAELPRSQTLSDDEVHPTLFGSLIASVILHHAILGHYPGARDISKSFKLYTPQQYFTAQQLISEQGTGFSLHPVQNMGLDAKQIRRAIIAATSTNTRKKNSTSTEFVN